MYGKDKIIKRETSWSVNRIYENIHEYTYEKIYTKKTKYMREGGIQEKRKGGKKRKDRKIEKEKKKKK